MRFTLAALAGAVLGLVCARASAKGACLKFSQSTDGPARALVLRIDNDCAEDMSCTLAWRVTCVSSTGGRTSTAHDETGLVISGANRTWTASAADCAAGDGYQISAPTWVCKALPLRSVARSP